MRNQPVIVGRKTETTALDNIYASNEAEFVAVYGRKRVGKTFLIQNYMKPLSYCLPASDAAFPEKSSKIHLIPKAAA